MKDVPDKTTKYPPGTPLHPVPPKPGRQERRHGWAWRPPHWGKPTTGQQKLK